MVVGVYNYITCSTVTKCVMYTSLIIVFRTSVYICICASLIIILNAKCVYTFLIISFMVCSCSLCLHSVHTVTKISLGDILGPTLWV